MEKFEVEIEQSKLDDLYNRLLSYGPTLRMNSTVYSVVEESIGWEPIQKVIRETFEAAKQCNRMIDELNGMKKKERPSEVFLSKIEESLDLLEQKLTTLEIALDTMKDVKEGSVEEVRTLCDMGWDIKDALSALKEESLTWDMTDILPSMEVEEMDLD